MSVSTVSLGEVNGTSTGRVSWGMNLPEFFDVNRVLIHDQRIEQAAQFLGSESLNIATEERRVDNRFYGAQLTNSIMPKLGNIVSERHAVDLFRTVEASEAGGADWIVINLSGVQEKVSDNEFTHNSLIRILSGGKNELTPDRHSFTWAPLIDLAIKSGIRDLADQKAGYNPLRQLRMAAAVATTLRTLVYSPQRRPRKITMNQHTS